MTETRWRSLTKALIWRASGFLILGAIAYWFTGTWSESLAISGWFNGIRLGLYYVHERAWLRVRWGRIEVEIEPAPRR